MILSFEIQAQSCPTDFTWGESVDVAYKGDIIYFLENSDINADQVNVEVEEYGSFECEVEVSRYSQSCLQISVNWFPGSDLSGCYVKLSSGQSKLGQSHVFMNY